LAVCALARPTPRRNGLSALPWLSVSRGGASALAEMSRLSGQNSRFGIPPGGGRPCPGGADCNGVAELNV